jgi:hypothetical protein
MPLLFYTLSFRKGLARDRVDGVIDADQLGRFDLLWGQPSWGMSHLPSNAGAVCGFLEQKSRRQALYLIDF